MNIKPLRGRILVKRPSPETQTASGIILTGKAEQTHEQGIVTAIGADVTNVKVGDTILIGKYSGQTIKVDGEPTLVVTEDDILAVVEGV